jgi:hypothetical protein
MRLTRPNINQGVSVHEYLCALLIANPQVECVSIMEYDNPPLLQDRVQARSPASGIVQRALDLRDATMLPFWDAALLKCFGCGAEAADLVRAASYHQSPQRSRRFVNRSEFSALARCGERGVAFCSEIKIDGESRFLPLIDFHCPDNERNDDLVRSVCEVLELGDVAVFSSGKSYHGYVLRVVSAEELRTILHHLLLFTPIVDRAYIAHQLIEECCALRITPTVSKPMTPVLKFVLTA